MNHRLSKVTVVCGTIDYYMAATCKNRDEFLKWNVKQKKPDRMEYMPYVSI